MEKDRVELVGRRVIVRSHRGSDAAPAFELIHGQTEILRWLVWQGPASVRELEEYYSGWVLETEEGSDYRFAVCSRESGLLVGSIGVRFVGHPRTGDVGYWIGVPHWNRGYASEAVRLAAHFAFAHVGAEALCAWVFEGNDPSCAVLKKAGFTGVHIPTSVGGSAGGPPGAPAQRQRYFTLLRAEWEPHAVAWEPVAQSIERASDSDARLPGSG